MTKDQNNKWTWRTSDTSDWIESSEYDEVGDPLWIATVRKREKRGRTKADFARLRKITEANARLIAAAPDMLVILKKVWALGSSRPEPWIKHCIEEIESVIAKAEVKNDE